MDTAGLVQLDDPGAVRGSGTEVVAAFRAVRDRSREVRASWLGLVGYYTAPEQGEVLAAMEVPVTEADAATDKAAVVARALSAYADRLEQLRAERQALVADMDAFTADRANIDADNRDNNVLESAWDAITGEQEQLLYRENELNERAAQLLADKEAAERDCANAIGDVWGGEHYEASGETWAGDTTTYGMTADAYVAMSRSGDAPWGHPVMWDSDNWLVRSNMLLGGASESFTGALDFFGDLVGVDGSGQAKAGWSGLWQLGVDSHKTSLLGLFIYDDDEVRASGERLLTVGKGIVAWDDWDTSGWYAGGSVGLDVITAIGTGGSAAAVKGGIKGAAATRFARLLEVGAAVDVRAAAAASRVRLGSVLSARLDDLSALGDRAASRLRLPGLEPAGVPRSLLGDTSVMRREADAPSHPRTDHPDLTSRGPGAPDHPTTRPVTEHPAGEHPTPRDTTPDPAAHPVNDAGPHTSPTTIDKVGDSLDHQSAPSDGGPRTHGNGLDYRFDEAGRRHLPDDPAGSWRDDAGRLRDESGSFLRDPYRSGDTVPGVFAEKGEPVTVDLLDGDHFPDYADAVHARADAATAHTDALVTRNALAAQHGLDTRRLTRDGVADYLRRQVSRGLLDETAAERVAETARAEWRTGDDLRAASQHMGEQAARDIAASRGELTLTMENRTGAGRFDEVGYGSPPPHLTIYEAKGGTATLGNGRLVGGVRYQQGTGQYLTDIARVDQGFRSALEELLANPATDSDLATAIRSGTVKIRYDLVAARPGGSVVVTPLRLAPDTVRLPTIGALP